MTREKLSREQRRQRAADTMTVIMVCFILILFGLLSIIHFIDWRQVDSFMEAISKDKPMIVAVVSMAVLILLSWVFLRMRK